MATITYTVTVASGTNRHGTGNKFYLNGTVSPDINLIAVSYTHLTLPTIYSV